MKMGKCNPKLILNIVVSVAIVMCIACILVAGQAKGEDWVAVPDDFFLDYEISAIDLSSDYCFDEYLFIEAPNKNNVYSKVRIKDDFIDRTYVEDGWFIIELNEERIQ